MSAKRIGFTALTFGAIYILYHVSLSSFQFSQKTIDSDASHCVFSTNNYSSEYYNGSVILDLSPLRHINMTVNASIWPGNSLGNLTFSPCFNSIITCDYSSRTMMRLNNRSGYCVDPAYWRNGSVSPFDNNNTIPFYAYVFEYRNGDLCFQNGRYLYYQTNITYYCQPRNRTHDQLISFAYYYQMDECHGQMSIGTYLACNTSNSSTPTPTIYPNGCLWHYLDHQLNLTEYKGTTLAEVDNKDNEQVWALSPCDNLLNCDGKYVNTYLYNITGQRCIKYLSVFQNGNVLPNYDPQSKSWQFIYENGEKCGDSGDFKSILEVYWQCDYSKKNSADIVFAQQLDKCSYILRINSSSACN